MSGELDCSKPLDRAGQAQKLIGVIDALLTQWASLNLHSFDSAFFLRQWPELHALYEQAKVLALGLGFVAPRTVLVHEIPATRTRVPGNGQVAYFVTPPRFEEEVTFVAATWEEEVKGWRVAAEAALAQEQKRSAADRLKAAEASTKPGLLRVACAGGLSVLLILGFECLVYGMSSDCLRNHTNSYGLQAGVDALIVSLMLCLFLPRWLKVLWLPVVLALALLLISLLGGPSKANPADYHMP
jgi:hypothetical protein